MKSKHLTLFFVALAALVLAGKAYSQSASFWGSDGDNNYYCQSYMVYDPLNNYTITGYTETLDWDYGGQAVVADTYFYNPDFTNWDDYWNEDYEPGYGDVWASVSEDFAWPGTYYVQGEHYGNGIDLGTSQNSGYVPGPAGEVSAAVGVFGTYQGEFEAEVYDNDDSDWDGLTVYEWGSSLTDGCYPYSQVPGLPFNLTPAGWGLLLGMQNYSETVWGSWAVGGRGHNTYGLDYIGLGGPGIGTVIQYYQALEAAGYMDYCGMEGPQTMLINYSGVYAQHGFGFQIFPNFVDAYRDTAAEPF